MSVNRDMIVTAAIMVALAATIYLYKELKQTNQDVLNCKTYAQSLSSRMAADDNTNKRRIVKEELGASPPVEDLSE